MKTPTQKKKSQVSTDGFQKSCFFNRNRVKSLSQAINFIVASLTFLPLSLSHLLCPHRFLLKCRVRSAFSSPPPPHVSNLLKIISRRHKLNISFLSDKWRISGSWWVTFHRNRSTKWTAGQKTLSDGIGYAITSVIGYAFHHFYFSDFSRFFLNNKNIRK